LDEVVDVLDMSRYFGRPGNLAGAVESLFSKLLGEQAKVDKSTRANMKGKKWEEMSEAFKEEVRHYAIEDARWTLKLWLVFGYKWPWHERELSRQTREMCMRGLPVDVDRAKEYQHHLQGLIWQAEMKIPWAKEDDAKILSPKRLAEECRNVGIEPPKSLAQDSPDCEAWEEKYGEQYEWVSAMRTYRRCNILLKKVETFIIRTKPDGWMPYGMKYFGAGSTGRWSGDAGLNVQNLPRKEMYGVDLRSLIKAPPGFKIIAPDLSAIEPRCLFHIVKDQPALDALAAGADVYEAHARATLGYTDPRPLEEVDPEMRRLSKARVLGCGYGCGPSKFVLVAKTLAGLEVSASEAERIVADYRASNPRIAGRVGIWRRLDGAIRKCAGRGDFTMELPSGRVITYRNISDIGDGLSAETCRNGKMMRSKLYGGLATENLVQATAREVFAEKLLNIEADGVMLLMHAHDEAVCLVPENEAEQKLKRVVEIMSETPDWMPGLPLAAKGYITDRYTK
jgi:DNA polymerase I-like protein with 3'-5' exonuclease and polymerase domains